MGLVIKEIAGLAQNRGQNIRERVGWGKFQQNAELGRGSG